MAVININNYAIIEGDSGSQYIEFVVYADAAVTADTYFYYYTQDGTASSANGDFFQTNGTGFIPAGQTSATVRITIYGDQQIEGNEYFQLVVLAGQNASLTNDAPALIATGVIRDDDDAVPDTPGDAWRTNEALLTELLGADEKVQADCACLLADACRKAVSAQPRRTSGEGE